MYLLRFIIGGLTTRRDLLVFSPWKCQCKWTDKTSGFIWIPHTWQTALFSTFLERLFLNWHAVIDPFLQSAHFDAIFFSLGCTRGWFFELQIQNQKKNGNNFKLKVHRSELLKFLRLRLFVFVIKLLQCHQNFFRQTRQFLPDFPKTRQSIIWLSDFLPYTGSETRQIGDNLHVLATLNRFKFEVWTKAI